MPIYAYRYTLHRDTLTRARLHCTLEVVPTHLLHTINVRIPLRCDSFVPINGRRSFSAGQMYIIFSTSVFYHIFFILLHYSLNGIIRHF